jgi:hypothetical protein
MEKIYEPNDLGFKPTGYEFIDWKSTPAVVIPAQESPGYRFSTV